MVILTSPEHNWPIRSGLLFSEGPKLQVAISSFCPSVFLREKGFSSELWGSFKASGLGDLTHTVSPNLMLILSTYRVVLHPSYLQKVFSFIIFIKEDTDYDPLRKKPSSWRRAVWAELKSDEHLLRLPTKQSFDAVSLTICSSESWPGSFIAGTAPSFQY